MSGLNVLICNDPSQDSALQILPAAIQSKLEANSIEANIRINHDPAALPENAGDPDVIFTNHKLDIRAIKNTWPSLKWVQVISAGVEAYLKTLPDDVILTNASGVHAEKGAEFILAAVLMLNYRIPFFVEKKRQHVWEPVFASVLRGKTVTLLGVGAIGGAAVTMLQERGLKVIGVTSRGTTDKPVDGCVSLDAIDAVLPRTDFLVSTLPLTPATEGQIGARELDLLPRGANVVVVGRAKVLDYAALGERLQDGRLGGAVLDVFPQEPAPWNDPVWETPNMIMTPHCSVDDHVGYIDRCVDIFIENLRRFGAGENLLNVVSVKSGY